MLFKSELKDRERRGGRSAKTLLALSCQFESLLGKCGGINKQCNTLLFKQLSVCSGVQQPAINLYRRAVKWHSVTPPRCNVCNRGQCWKMRD